MSTVLHPRVAKAAGPRRTMALAFPHASCARGFSLLEVIAATLLLAIAFAALLQVAGGSIALTRNADDHSQAALWARSLLDTVDIVTPLQPGVTEGRFDEEYRWRLAVTPWGPQGQPDPKASMHMVKLDLDVFWGRRAHERSAHFSTLRMLGTARSP